MDSYKSYVFESTLWSTIRYRGGEMDSLLQIGQRLGVLKRSRFLKAKPQRRHCAGSIVSRFGGADLEMCWR